MTGTAPYQQLQLEMCEKAGKGKYNHPKARANLEKRAESGDLRAKSMLDMLVKLDLEKKLSG